MKISNEEYMFLELTLDEIHEALGAYALSKLREGGVETESYKVDDWGFSTNNEDGYLRVNSWSIGLKAKLDNYTDPEEQEDEEEISAENDYIDPSWWSISTQP